MTKTGILALLILCLALDVFGLKLEQCPPGFRCRKRVPNPLFRAAIRLPQEEFEVEICEAGTYSPGGSEVCIPCAAGTYADMPGAPACYSCPRGHMCPRTDLAPEQCPHNTYNSLTRQTCCRTCALGQVARYTGMFQCEDCPSGTKCPAQQKMACESTDGQVQEKQ